MAFNPNNTFFPLQIHNIGKLSEARLHIGQFTVFAGPNNTGKSFVSKILYSLFNAMNANLPEVHMHSLTGPVHDSLRHIHVEREAHADSPVNALKTKIREMENLVRGTLNDLETRDDFRNLDDFRRSERAIISKLRDMAKDLLELLPGIRSALGPSEFEKLEMSLESLQKSLAGMTLHQFIRAGLMHLIQKNLLANFQIPKVSDLRGKADGKERAAFCVESVGAIGSSAELGFSDEGLNFSIDPAGLRLLQRYSKVLYLETPMLWKLKGTLEELRLSDRHRWHDAHRERITGIPEYFYDLARRLKSEYTGEMNFRDLHAKLTGENVLGGKLVISETGEIRFLENGRHFPLSLTATGIINLGILALLIEHKILDKESFLFIDEPEAHLHPAWQVVMAEALFELAKGGAHVVIATHSADILKWLEVHVKKNPQDEKLIELNQFPAQSLEDPLRDFDDKMAAIKQGLTKPFADLYLEGL